MYLGFSRDICKSLISSVNTLKIKNPGKHLYWNQTKTSGHKIYVEVVHKLNSVGLLLLFVIIASHFILKINLNVALIIRLKNQFQELAV